MLAVLLQHDAEHRVNPVRPPRPRVGEHEPVVRRLDAAADKSLLRERDPFGASRVRNRDFLRLFQRDELLSAENVAGHRVDFVGVRAFVRVELQNPAGLPLVAAQLGSCENDLLRRLVQPRVCKRDFLRLFRRDENRCADRSRFCIRLEFQQLVQRHAGDLIRRQTGFVRCRKDPVGLAAGNLVFLGDFRNFGVIRRFGVENERADGVGLLQRRLDFR